MIKEIKSSQEQRAEAFKKELTILQEKFSLEVRAAISVTMQGIVPVLQLFDTTPVETDVVDIKSAAQEEAKEEKE